MKLDQQQMLVASQLFMAAGQAGAAFDLRRFTQDAAYAAETLAQLAMQASSKNNGPLQRLVQQAMESLARVMPDKP